MVVLVKVTLSKEVQMERKKRILIATLAALIFVVPMLIDMPDRTLAFFIFVFPVAFVSFFTVLTLVTLKNNAYKKASFAIVALVCFAQFYWTYVGSGYALFKALSYSLVGMGIAATVLLVLNYMVEIYNEDEDEDDD